MKPELFNELRKIRNEIAHVKISENDAVKQLKKLGFSIPQTEIHHFFEKFSSLFDPRTGNFVPSELLGQTIAQLLEGTSAKVLLDPWAGFGILVSSIQETTHAEKVYAFTKNENEAKIGEIFANNVKLKVGDPLEQIQDINEKIDVIICSPPFNFKYDKPLTLISENGKKIQIKSDVGNLIILAASQKLSQDGIGIFVVPGSFFFSHNSAIQYFAEFGLGIEAALSLPSQIFAPYTTIQTYLLVVRKHTIPKMFIAQISNELNTNREIIANFKNKVEGTKLELGRFVESLSFSGIESLKIAERFEQKTLQFGAPAIKLTDLSLEINLGRFGQDFDFSDRDGSIYIPLIGNSDVIESLEDLKIKKQNYAQVVIDPRRSNSTFVAQFLNSELGKEIRDLNKTGTTIPKLNKHTLMDLPILVPDLQTQKEISQIESRIISEQNTLASLQSELMGYKRELWSNPRSAQNVDKRLSILSQRLSGNLKQHADVGLDQWFETLPFPLASILRAWQATPSQDYKTKYEHLLHFFEATAEFSGLIFISAYRSNDALFEIHENKISEVLQKQKLSFQRASFGTWKVIVEYLGKQTRLLLAGKNEDRALCAALFGNPSLILPERLSDSELPRILSATNKMRNDWRGHGGVLGQNEAKARNELLVAELQKLREIFADVWTEIQLVQALNCRPRRGVFENEIAIMQGSNSEFLKEPRSMSIWLDVERLYLSSKDSNEALKLLPLIRVGPSPRSANNACYFFNRIEHEGMRFVSYHYIDEPEFTSPDDEEISKLFPAR